MSSTDSTVPGASGRVRGAKDVTKKHSPPLSVLAIVLALVGGFLTGWSFLQGLAVSTDPKADQSSVYIALFFLGVGIVVVGIVFAVIGVVRRAHRTVSLVALVLSMLPSFVVLVIAALRFL